MLVARHGWNERVRIWKEEKKESRTRKACGGYRKSGEEESVERMVGADQMPTEAHTSHCAAHDIASKFLCSFEGGQASLTGYPAIAVRQRGEQVN